jgi:hypothetical protein
MTEPTAEPGWYFNLNADLAVRPSTFASATR